ncbi:hypothetical protein ELI24_26780 (plasmid) [Rhizobium ruizarguesonis]|nr:hypothetical protein ELI53_27780 [Rhizobium ruizarguesonis]TAU15736.1 hypothetical protein ELI47_37515 [Rhizobium ruizarguesonis]TAV87640.1 hypothetical protein ELI24_26780 [Rhizobium ruizarguesonis]TAW13088.1 hypothetical protein ELI20_26310 [Rhizobium ruizarguesonis]TAZ65533.1 hypothetical protein ELH72_38015 [Rhizobium ruizarguesonis]
MKRSERHVFLHRTVMTLFPQPDRMTSPGGCAGLAREPCEDDLVRRFCNSRGDGIKISTPDP